ncbi:cytochrome b [Pyrobaculum calidifontis]|uniref:Cytochrome b/b6, N-terminal domain protein n=1 Tax=Pyrobaculum calidifontis (strain DSM 21063 / JCM 11548 / VA1) TaxID=410359 RepID=A3MXG1_PYRCJ|nr:cytochrome bc complex cytochrome b subunit [Pyrobaculum calidifontis]ABO09328.1 Cytochrome b/b6, N-terminal domain protein [Pyrobaculum calidifontis JCM 11548]
MRALVKLWELILERFHLKEFLEHPVPRYSNINPLYWFGDVAAVSFFLLALTGFFLALLYTPSLDVRQIPASAIMKWDQLYGVEGGEVSATGSYLSVYKIVYLTPFGFILRQFHLWAAYLMIMAALVHFFAKFVLGAYKRRGGGALWFLGVLLGVLTINQAVLGYILPLHLDGILALMIGLNLFRYFDYLGIPVGGTIIALLGSNYPTNEVVKMVYVLHILIVPAVILILLGLKIQGILYGGVSPPPVKNEALRQKMVEDKEPFYPHRFALMVGQVFLQISFLLLLVAFFPQPLLEPWAPGQGVPTGVRPPWPVMWYYTYVKMIDPFISVGLPFLLVLFALVVPLLDRRGGVSVSERWVWILIAILYMAVIGYGTVLGFIVDIPKQITPFTRIVVPPDSAVPYVGTPTPVG